MAKKSQKNTLGETVRLDRWLWAARFFKTRALATEAIRAGHVQRQGQRIKPAKGVTIGDRLEIRKGEELFVVDVLALSSKRTAASIAQRLYSETEKSVALREKQQAERRLQRSMGVQLGTEGKPDKRQRRLLHKFRQSHDSGT